MFELLICFLVSNFFVIQGFLGPAKTNKIQNYFCCNMYFCDPHIETMLKRTLVLIFEDFENHLSPKLHGAQRSSRPQWTPL